MYWILETGGDHKTRIDGREGITRQGLIEPAKRSNKTRENNELPGIVDGDSPSVCVEENRHWRA
jgi:hypothetical protein